MAVQYAPTKLKVPPGFQNLLEGLAREVLREQPENIIEFAANYFRSQVAILGETGRDDAKKGADMETLAQGEEVDIDLDDPSTADAALKIQAVFRGHKSRQVEKQKQKEDEAAVKIQAGFRGHQVRKSMKDLQSGEEGEEKQATVEDSKEFVEKVTENETAEETKDFEDPKYGEAATKIQAGFRGFKTREELKGRLSKDKLAEEPAEQVDGEESGAAKEEEAAAVKIQASFRGHKARKEVETMKATQSDESVAKEADSLQDDDLDVNASEEAATKIQAGYRGFVARKQVEALKASKTSEDHIQDDVDMEAKKSEEAAVKIQAGYRGYVARKEVEAMKDPKTQEDSEDIENDMEVKRSEDAAVKIQAGFRGFVARKEVEAIKASKSQEASAEKTDDEPTKDDSEATGEKIEENDDVDQEKAAVKIQASYRGYKTRASLKSDSLPKLSEKDESVTKDTNDNIQEEDGEAEA
ncbi:uncharacterized protein LOC135684955 isoform X1 [Rhopilema esculentum]|uniref:uncharacterized protein LOC135684955 isoform X1 n=1 Tax=Rhopilema esculentum TaxID=499914 RepID=UPI0031D7406C